MRCVFGDLGEFDDHSVCVSDSQMGVMGSNRGSFVQGVFGFVLGALFATLLISRPSPVRNIGQVYGARIDDKSTVPCASAHVFAGAHARVRCG